MRCENVYRSTFRGSAIHTKRGYARKRQIFITKQFRYCVYGHGENSKCLTHTTILLCGHYCNIKAKDRFKTFYARAAVCVYLLSVPFKLMSQSIEYNIISRMLIKLILLQNIRLVEITNSNVNSTKPSRTRVYLLKKEKN